MKYLAVIRDYGQNKTMVHSQFHSAEKANDYIVRLKTMHEANNMGAHRYYVAKVLNEYTAERG